MVQHPASTLDERFARTQAQGEIGINAVRGVPGDYPQAAIDVGRGWRWVAFVREWL